MSHLLPAKVVVNLLLVYNSVMEIKKILFVGLFIYVCVKLDVIQYVRVVWSFYIFYSTLRRILQTPIYRMWKRFKARSCDTLQAEYNEKMHSCDKEAVLFNGPSQLTEDTDQPQLECDAGTGANVGIAYNLDDTILACVDPIPQFTDELINDAAMSMF